MEQSLKYIFWLSLILIAVAYYVGTTSVLGTLGQNLGSLMLTATGRTSSGTFAAYPKSS